MCGLTGFWDIQQRQGNGVECIQAMTALLANRGPDGSGVWWDRSLGLAFGHRRLKILDLSETGHQPMVSASGRFVLIYNGEIYNSPDLRKRLMQQGISFRGTSDTEVLLEAWEAWGPLETCQSCVGMFAFALWDRKTRTLFLVRDRLGVKPLYWGIQDEILFFGSTLRSFSGHPLWHPVLDQRALDCVLRLGYVPSPLSIFEDMHKVEQGTFLRIQEAPYGRSYDVQKQVYWKPPLVEAFRQESESVLLQEAESLFYDAVSCRLLSDVPVGAYLSGGIDSSLVVAMMQSISKTPVKTFSVGFEDVAYNEAPYAAAIAKHLGTDHHDVTCTFRDIETLLPMLSLAYDEPFADSSQIPTLLVSRLAQEQVKVCLSGDGGDELFGGYTRYLWGQRVLGPWQSIPFVLRRWMAYGLECIPDSFCKAIGIASHKITKLARILKADASSGISEEIYRELLVHCRPEVWLVQGQPTPFLWPYPKENFQGIDLLQRFQRSDLLSCLPDDFLVKVDRASMAYGLEVRSPFLDHRLLEFAWGLPSALKIRQGQTKRMLKKILSKYVPVSLTERPKKGFSIPLGSWLRGPLLPWASDLLSDLNPDLFHASFLQCCWQEHQNGLRDHSGLLWNVLMVQAWIKAAPCRYDPSTVT
jgi:asparagine synthase (glutamine-hydrolysing)